MNGKRMCRWVNCAAGMSWQPGDNMAVSADAFEMVVPCVEVAPKGH